jgi:hypothetical protein
MTLRSFLRSFGFFFVVALIFSLPTILVALMRG